MSVLQFNTFQIVNNYLQDTPKVLTFDKIRFKECKVIAQPTFTLKENALPLSAGDAFFAEASLQRRLKRSDGKEVLRVLLEAEELSSMKYQPGDTIGILPENSADDVNKVLQQIGCKDADSPIEVENNDSKRQYLPKFTTIRELFSKYVNIKAIPLKQVLAALAQYTSDDLERQKLRHLASRQGSEDYKSVILESGISFFQLLQECNGCQPPPDVLIQVLPRLLPRTYSIATSPLSSPSRIGLALSILPGEREGLCTGMIRRRFSDASQFSLQIYLRKSNGFCLPEDGSVPLYLVGPGTGVAPFIGFLDHLRLQGIKRPVFLFTGFRNEAENIFKDELDLHLENETLTELSVSYSRQDGTATKYVQEALKENWKDIGNGIINEQGIIYVCGDFKKMEETVSDAFTTVIQKYTGLEADEAHKIVKELKANKRYLNDIWS